MSKINKFFILVSALLMVSCYSSEENYEYGAEVALKVTGLESHYSVVAVEETLNIELEVELTNPSDELEYEWRFIRKYTDAIYGGADASLDYEIIGTEKNLSYVTSEKPGTYQIYVTVTNKSTGQLSTLMTTLSITNSFTDGYYVIKEESGMTDFDIHTPSGVVVESVLKSLDGESLSGKPLSLSIFPYYRYVDKTTFQGIDSKAVAIVSEERMQIRDIADLSLVYTEEDAFFFGTTGADIKLAMPNNSGAYLFTDKGLYRGVYSTFSGGTGQFGEVIYLDQESDPNMNVISDGSYIYIFDERNNRFMQYDSNGGHQIHADTYDDETVPVVAPVNGNEHNLLYYGTAEVGSSNRRNFAIMEDNLNSNKRYLYEMDVIAHIGYDWMNRPRYGPNPNNPISKVTEFENTNLNKANYFAMNEREAEVLMYAADNKLYSYTIATGEEAPLLLTGIPEGENIVFMKNRYWLKGTYTPEGLNYFNHLIIATQTGDKYKVYIYNINGSIPTGAPVKVLEGNGIFSSIQYIDTKLDVNSDNEYSLSF